MNPTQAHPVRSDVSLSDKYRQEEGVVFMSGNQALVRLPLQQRMRDSKAGLRTAGLISGYRGSPLGRYDMELWQAGALLREHAIHFQPGINEDLAATAIWGSQFVPILPNPRYDGVFGIWYGKGPGVDRSGDAFKHANAGGTAALGGVLALAGDDHAAKSSTQAHQSDQAFIAAGIPVLYPSDVQEILDYGLHGIAMSRYAGCWVALKLVTDVVEGSGAVYVAPDSPTITLPAYAGGVQPDLYIKRFEPAPLQESRLYKLRLPAALAYARANGLNRLVAAAPGATIGIVTAGKSYADTRQALAHLNVSDSQARVLKIGMVWPLDPEVVTAFAAGLDTIIVIEEKRALLEDQIKTILYDAAPGGARPRVIGKFSGASVWSATPGEAAFSMVGELNPSVIAERLAQLLGIEATNANALAPAPVTGLAERSPTFCSGCPHSTSTRVPEGSMALAGIGCHSITLLLDPVRTGPISHMGAEGAMWVGQAPFTDTKHVFANIGDGTYFHSGFLAIRQAVAAKVSITYKLLLNGFVSMTGGQPIEGELTPAQLATELLAEGVARVVIVTDDPDKFKGQALPANVPVHHRERLDLVQRELREQGGVSVLIYDQMCATERRRQRKRGKLPEPQKRTFINAAVCEGCGDCGDKSNCLSVEPLVTELGRKRQINQASCNKDFSCVQGFCPSFVTVHGGTLRRKTGVQPGKQSVNPADIVLPEPVLPALDTVQGIIVTGIGGTGVITVGAILSMAAHLDGLFATSLDLTGLAQKYGAVMSHIRLSRDQAQLHSYRLARAEADVVLGCDLIVTASSEAIDKMSRARTRVIVNTDISPTRDFARNPDWNANAPALRERIAAASTRVDGLAVTAIATALLGDPLAANMFVLGYAWQQGWIGISRQAIEQAITLNAMSVEFNLASFAWGRVAAHDPARVQAIVEPASAPDSGARSVVHMMPRMLTRLDDIVAHRSAALVDYQDEAYARRYRNLVERVASRERALTGGDKLARAVARYYYKLLAYKDEFEVARLYAAPEFRAGLEREFEGDFKLHFHLGAGPFARYLPGSKTPLKREVGGWILPVFRVLARLRFLRGTALDPFRRNAERRAALDALATYEADIERLLAELSADKIDRAADIAALPEQLRGYGHVRETHAARVAEQRRDLWARWSAAETREAVAA